MQRLTKEPYGFFEFAPSEGLDLDLLDRTLVAAADEVDSVDCVIFPESAVDESEIADLEAVLDHHGVIYLQAGVRERSPQPGQFGGNWMLIAVSPGLERGGLWRARWTNRGFTSARTSTTGGRWTKDRSSSTTWAELCTLRSAGGRRWTFLVWRCNSCRSGRRSRSSHWSVRTSPRTTMSQRSSGRSAPRSFPRRCWTDRSCRRGGPRATRAYWPTIPAQPC